MAAHPQQQHVAAAGLARTDLFPFVLKKCRPWTNNTPRAVPPPPPPPPTHSPQVYGGVLKMPPGTAPVVFGFDPIWHGRKVTEGAGRDKGRERGGRGGEGEGGRGRGGARREEGRRGLGKQVRTCLPARVRLQIWWVKVPGPGWLCVGPPLRRPRRRTPKAELL